MRFSLKTYKFTKIKTTLKQTNFLFLCNIITPNGIVDVSQFFKKFNLNGYKIYNTLAKKKFKNSIYYHYLYMLDGFVIFIKPEKTININHIMQFNPNFVLIGVKLNSKLYSGASLKYKFNIKFNYNKESADLIKTMKQTVKIFSE